MQRQLLQISEKIPDDIMLTLLKSFAQVLTREPEPVQKTPFIRAFAKIRDDNIETLFSAIVEEDEDQLKDYESENSEGENDCTFNYKVSTTTEEIVYSLGEKDQNGDLQSALIEDITENESSSDDPTLNGVESYENEENSEHIDEGIEIEMPKLTPADETAEPDVEETVDQEQILEASQSVNDGDNIESSDLEKGENETPENSDEPLDPKEVENIIIEQPIPVEPPKVSLDDIQREIQEMQMFLLGKGVGAGKKSKSANQESNGNANDQEVVDSKNVEDAYKVDVCIELKNRNGGSQTQNSQNKHHHSKYNRSENYKDEITKAGPIFDPSVPNTDQDFMKFKSVSERIHRKQQKVQALDNSWQNLCENQKKLYKYLRSDIRIYFKILIIQTISFQALTV